MFDYLEDTRLAFAFVAITPERRSRFWRRTIPTTLILPWRSRKTSVVVCEQFGVAPPRGNRPQRPFRFATSQMILEFRLESIVEPGVRCARAVRGRCARLWAQSAADVRGRGPCARRYRHICRPLESAFVSERNIKNIGGKTLPDIDPSQVPTCLPGSRGVCEAFWHLRGPGHASEDQLLSAAEAV